VPERLVAPPRRYALEEGLHAILAPLGNYPQMLMADHALPPAGSASSCVDHLWWGGIEPLYLVVRRG
jgi:hypothetical protein